MHTPKFSVIVPTHNAAGYIRKGLDSIRAQTFRDYELIVVCDDCTDNTERIALEYTDRVFPVKYNRDGKSREKGIAEARGDWILFMDDDDWWLHEYTFQQIADNVGKHDEDVLFFSFIWKGVGYKRQTADNMFVAVWNKAWRREFIQDVHFSDDIYGSDVAFHYAAIRKGPRAAFWDMPMYYYNYMRKGSLSWRNGQGEFC